MLHLIILFIIVFSIASTKRTSGLRDGLYTSAKLLGDLEAIAKGRVGSRIYNRILGRATGNLLSKTQLRSLVK